MLSNNSLAKSANYLILILSLTFHISISSLEDFNKPSISSTSQPANSEHEDKPWQWYKFGDLYEYFSQDPITLKEHFEKLDRQLDNYFHWIFEFYWEIRKEDKEIQAPYYHDMNNVIEEFKDKLRLFNCYYEEIRRYTYDYVDPEHIPKNVAWWLGIFTGYHSSYLDDDSNYNLPTSKQKQLATCLDFYKASLLYLSYYFDISEKSPLVLQYQNYKEMADSPTFSFEIDSDFQKELANLNEDAWVKAMLQLDPKHLNHLYNLLRSISSFILKNRESLPDSSLRFAAQLTNINTKLIIAAQKNPSNNLDAINAFMFKIFIDLKKWETLQKQDATISYPYVQELLPIVQKQCSILLPKSYTLESISEDNEYEVVNAVRSRNWIRKNPPDPIKGEVIFDEFEFSPSTMRQYFTYTNRFFDERAHFAAGYSSKVSNFMDSTEQIYNYRCGFIDIDDMPITEGNALDYLMEIKVFDQVAELWNTNYPVDYEAGAGIHVGYRSFGFFKFTRTTYELRKHILKLCPQLRSYEALTLAIHPDKVRDEQEEATHGAWIIESEAIRQACIDELVAKAKYLFELIANSPLQGIIVGTRGISGAGKSTYIKRNILPLLLPEDQNDPDQIDYIASGILNPDTLKATLKKLQGDTLNTQVHDEASNAFKKVFKEIADQGSYILDKRQLTPHDIIKTLIEPAERIGHSVWLFDFDIPLSTCMYRILARPLKGAEPCPEYEALVDGYLALRRYRSQVIALACKVDTIAKYELYATSKQTLVAHKTTSENCPNGSQNSTSLCIHDHHLLEDCLKIPTYAEIENELSLLITDASIDKAIANGDISPDQRESIEQWLGLSIKEAIQGHVQGSKGDEDESLFEPAELMPFNGSEWLSDIEPLINFINREHRLHLHGVDDSGRGLHWEAGELKREYTSKYYPETKVTEDALAGFQMKMGYFIVPKENLQMLFSNLSPHIAKELTVRDENGNLLGIRFFVHPTAYAHYAPLLAANIEFVPPSKSEFMGTPTSSYNSWILRRVDIEGRYPFIVKMGTPNGSGDIKHLLAGEDIIKSISLQKDLDKTADSDDLIYFKETAGFILYEIPRYPLGTIDSGIIISEIPDSILFAESRFVSLASVMSCERIRSDNIGVKPLNADLTDLHSLPIIYEIIEKSLQLGLVDSVQEFIQKYLIEGFKSAFESIALKANCTLTPENLYLVLNMDNSFKGFAYRDLRGISLRKQPAEFLSCQSYKPILTKLLNVLTRSEVDEIHHPEGTSERSIYYYLNQKLNDEGKFPALDGLQRLSISQDEVLQLINSNGLYAPKP